MASKFQFAVPWRMRLLPLVCWLIGWIFSSPLPARPQADRQRPKILGLSHVAISVHDMKPLRMFYEDILGFNSPFTLQHPDGSDWIVNLKVNDQQFIELVEEPAKADGPLSHFALYTDNAKLFAEQVKARGVQLAAEPHTGQVGNEFFSLRDPDGHLIEVVEYKPGSRTAQDKGLFLPASRASEHLLAVGIRVRSSPLSIRFYREVLGLREVARVAPSASDPGAVVLRVPDGKEEVVLLLFKELPSLQAKPAEDFVCLADHPEAGHSDDPSTAGRGMCMPATRSAAEPRIVYDPEGMRIKLVKTVPAHPKGTPAGSRTGHEH
jgi:lactoylglutathione lyase